MEDTGVADADVTVEAKALVQVAGVVGTVGILQEVQGAEVHSSRAVAGHVRWMTGERAEVIVGVLVAESGPAPPA